MARGTTSPMEKILENPGLMHLAENIFSNLNDADVEICQNINQISKEILDNPMFWLRKFRNLSQKDQKDWVKDSALPIDDLFTISIDFDHFRSQIWDLRSQI